jgi:N-acetylglutamate synthase-like GNAT family acetyltransferase
VTAATDSFKIVRLEDLPLVHLEPIRLAAHAEGFNHVRRLLEDHLSGTNRFDQPGEFLLAARVGNGAIIGVGGLNRVSDATGRVRRMYVLPDWRDQGVGGALLTAILEQSRFPRLELRAMNADAARFYERHGFNRVDSPDHTHVLERGV